MFLSEGLPIFRFIMGSEFFLDTEEGGSFHTVKGLKVQHQRRPFITRFFSLHWPVPPQGLARLATSHGIQYADNDQNELNHQPLGWLPSSHAKLNSPFSAKKFSTCGQQVVISKVSSLHATLTVGKPTKNPPRQLTFLYPWPKQN